MPTEDFSSIYCACLTGLCANPNIVRFTSGQGGPVITKDQISNICLIAEQMAEIASQSISEYSG